MRIHNLLIKKCLGFVTHFHNDLLEHDKNEILSHDKNTPFVHFTRKTGTHLISFIPTEKYPKKSETVKYLFGQATREKILRNITIDMIPYIRREWPDNLIHYFDGYCLQKITLEQAIILIRSYYIKIMIDFKKG